MLLTTKRKLKILDFDIENRPLTYWWGDKCTAEITVIAWSWVGQKTVTARALGEVSSEQMLSDFVKVYNEADIVTGHYIRRHDLPIINGALMLHGLPGLDEKLTSDTKIDLVKRADLPASQEALAHMRGIANPKPGMSQADWREANRLTPVGIKLAKSRCIGDIEQHKALRASLLDALPRPLLGPPKIWRP